MEYILLGLLVIVVVLLIVLIVRSPKKDTNTREIQDVGNRIETLRSSMDSGFINVNNSVSRQGDSTANIISNLNRDIREGQDKSRQEVSLLLNNVQETNARTIRDLRLENNEAVKIQRTEIKNAFESVRDGLNNISKDITQNLIDIKDANTRSIEKMRQDNQASMDKINDTVNEKLQKTLDDKLSKSFETVRSQLVEVEKSLGEMRTVASGVTDLKNVLSNVKTRGVIGEYQLEAILAEILTNDQYEVQFPIETGGTERVDFAIKLPGTAADENSYVYLPMDSKFPGDTYQALVNALETGDSNMIQNCKKLLKSEILKEAKSISDKYIKPPYTTDFAIMFLPFEGLYAEVVNMGLLEEMQSKYRVNVAGPSTTAALLNSFRMGFRTLAIQKRSGEVYQTLEAVRKEFSTFEKGLESMKQRLSQAGNELDKLIGTRTRAINRKLRDVADITMQEADEILGISEDMDE